MKDQYFGDVNDFRKYALLRALAIPGNLRLGVCWMLTASDSRTDGRHLAYLEWPGKYRQYDPALFDWLRHVIHEEQDRRISRIETSGLLGNVVFYSANLSDAAASRDDWFAECLDTLRDCDLVFFDADNGLERSTRYGRRDSCKFLYWPEVREFFASGSSVLIYQHFAREPRGEFVNRLALRLRVETRANSIFSFRTPNVLFLLASQVGHSASFLAAVSVLRLAWSPHEIAVTEH